METKVCSKCKEEKDISNFPKFLQRDGSYGIRGTCKKCMNEKYNAGLCSNGTKNYNTVPLFVKYPIITFIFLDLLQNLLLVYKKYYFSYLTFS
jgi:hypothetical protein